MISSSGPTARLTYARSLALFGSIMSARAADYVRKRMGSVFSRTVKKELSALRGFLLWCEEQGYVEIAPVIPRPPRRALGTPFKRRRRGKATEVSLEDVRAVINKLPEWSESRKVSRFPIRPRFIVAFETALRPATLDKLRSPEHYRRGAATLTITDEIDKARFGRQLPLSDEARAVLDSVVPESGLIFGRHDYRVQVKKAAEAVLTKEQAKTFTQYDLRHARITQLAETGNLPGVAFIAGHVQASTTSGYIHSNRKAAERTLAIAGATGFSASIPNPASQRNRLAGVAKPLQALSLCEGEDLNLHGSYPASTSS
jgi:integrase